MKFRSLLVITSLGFLGTACSIDINEDFGSDIHVSIKRENTEICSNRAADGTEIAAQDRLIVSSTGEKCFWNMSSSGDLCTASVTCLAAVDVSKVSKELRDNEKKISNLDVTTINGKMTHIDFKDASGTAMPSVSATVQTIKTYIIKDGSAVTDAQLLANGYASDVELLFEGSNINVSNSSSVLFDGTASILGTDTFEAVLKKMPDKIGIVTSATVVFDKTSAGINALLENGRTWNLHMSGHVAAKITVSL